MYRVPQKNNTETNQNDTDTNDKVNFYISPIIVHSDLHFELIQVFNLLCIFYIHSVLFLFGHPVANGFFVIYNIYTFVNPYAIGTQKLPVAGPKNMHNL